MQKLQRRIPAGLEVHARGDRWRVVATEHFDACTVVTLHGVGDDNRGRTTRLIAPFDRIEPIARYARPIAASRVRVLCAAARAIVSSPSWHDCWTAPTARIDLREWQLQPARAALSGATRLLLADEVGLGKTIQAALIVAELSARGWATRTLVLTPASLREQWAAELSQRFDLPARVFDQAAIKTLVAQLPAGVNPWSTAALIVSSIDLVKRPEIRVAVDAVPFDVLIVDEAHHLTPGTDRAAMVSDLSSRVPWVILVTATPHSGDDNAYHFLKRLGDVSGRDDIRVFRRTNRDVHESRDCRARIVRVAPSDAERSLLDATLEYAQTLWRFAGGQQSGAGLVGSIIARRAASCADAALRTLQRRHALLSGEASTETQTALPWDEGDTDDAEDSDVILGARGLPDQADERAMLAALIERARAAAGRSSKVELIRRALRLTQESALIFSEYRDTAAWVASLLANDCSVATLHGGLSALMRRESIDAFTSAKARVLVATDAAGEGLNLQARCRLVINLELPWSPLRLQQRLGRVARIGQTRRVHAWHLVHGGSFEDRVLARLERRRMQAAQALAASRHESCSASSAEATARRLDALLCRTPTDANAPTTALIAAVTTGSEHTGGFIAVYAVNLTDRNGYVAERQLVALEQRASAIDLREVHRHAREESVRRAADLPRRLESFIRGASVRLEDVTASIEARDAQTMWQGSLFDRRVEQALHTRRTAVTAWLEQLRRHLARVDGLRQIEADTPRLVAVWPLA